MQIKIMRGNQERIFECANISVMTVTEGMAAAKAPIGVGPGIYIELSEVNGAKGTMHRIVLPDDGDTVYVMNSAGKTTNTYRWPIAPRREAVS